MANGTQPPVGFSPGPLKERQKVVVTRILLPFFLLITFIVAAGLAYTAQYIVNELTKDLVAIVRHIPFGVGRKLARWIGDLGQNASHWFGKQAAGADKEIGQYYHSLASLFSQVAEEILAISVLAGYIVYYVTKKYALPAIAGRQTHLGKQGKTQTQTQTQIKRRVGKLEVTIRHPTQGKLGAATATRLRPLSTTQRAYQRQTTRRFKKIELEIGRVVLPKVETVEKTQTETKRQTRTQGKRLSRLEKLLGGFGVAGIVVWGLSKIGAGWLQCRNWKRLGRGVCRAPTHLIDDLLGLIADFVVLTNICQVLPWLEAGASTVAGPIISTLSKAGAGLCQDGEGKADPLAVPPLYRPPVAGFSTLHLP